jgi:Family of unknown function (DUF6069)
MPDTPVTANHPDSETAIRNHRRLMRATAVATSSLAATAAWLIAVPFAGVDLVVDRWDGAGTMTVLLAHVVATAMIASLAGWAALAVLERLTRRARTAWTVGASIALLASLLMPLTAGATTAAAVTLAALHLVVGAILIPTLARSAR